MKRGHRLSLLTIIANDHCQWSLKVIEFDIIILMIIYNDHWKRVSMISEDKSVYIYHFQWLVWMHTKVYISTCAVEILFVFDMEKEGLAAVCCSKFMHRKSWNLKTRGIGRSGSNHTWPSFLELKNY